jgi:hypothetical protein
MILTCNVPASCASSQKAASWWRQSVFPGALIPKADATLALQLILSELRIAVDARSLDFKTEQVVQPTFWQALEKLTDSDLGVGKGMLASRERIGMRTFGASAPLKELQKKFGFTADGVVSAASGQVNKAQR